MKERIVIVFIAVVVGLLITTLGFFLYESSRDIAGQELKKPVSQKTNGMPAPKKEELLLTVNEPADEGVVDRRTITVKGSTKSDNVIVISTNQEDIVATPASDGKFSASIMIDAGTNKLITRAISPSGQSTIDERTITYSTEKF